MELDFFLNGVLVPPPRNWKELQIELLFESDKPSASLQAIPLEWVGTNATLVNNYILQGVSGGVGIYEGLPLQIKSCSGGLMIFDGILDLANDAALFECDIVKCPIKEAGRVDYVNDIAESFTFAFLASSQVTGAAHISTTDYLAVPFTITTHRTSFERISMILSLFMIGKELYETVKRTQELINTIIADIAGIATVTSTAYAILKVAAMVLNILLYIVYIVALLAALVTMLIDLIDLVYPIKRYKLGMKVKTMFEKACAYMGLSFYSTILASGSQYENLIWIPRKYTIPSTSNPLSVFSRGYNELGSPKAYGYYDGTFKQFILDMQEYFNARVMVKNNIFYFEKLNYWNKTNPYIIPDTNPVGYTFNSPEPHGTNASDLPSNYLVIYQVDGEDINTYQRYAGTSYQVQVRPTNVINQKNVLLKNLVEKRFNMALVKRKDYMNEMETQINAVLTGAGNLINDIIQFVNKLLAFVTGNPPASNPPPYLSNTRIGWMELASPFIGVPKIFVGQYNSTDGKWYVHPNNQTLTAAQTIFETFHRCNLATTDPATGTHGQYLTYKNKKMPLCCSDYMVLTNNNILMTPKKKYGKFYRILWNLHQETADVDYGLNEKFTTNLTEQITIDGNS